MAVLKLVHAYILGGHTHMLLFSACIGKAEIHELDFVVLDHL